MCKLRELRRTIAQLRRSYEWCANLEGVLVKLPVRELRELRRTIAQLRRSFKMVRDFGGKFILISGA